ncbi:MAG: hypothetical protein ACRD9S_24065, partial [Pyrinomonadaceae bacterium]
FGMSTQLKKLQKQVDALRNKLGFSAKGTVIYLAPRDGVGEKLVVVEADGFGGAVTRIVEGNYPLDFFTSHEKSFTKESAAVDAAEIIVERDVDPATILFRFG